MRRISTAPLDLGPLTSAKLTNEQYDAFKDGKLYVNGHSDAYKGGEIRGQLNP